MPSQEVRDAVRAAWLVLMPDVRYIDTINRSMPYNPPLPLPDIWGTLAFNTTYRRQVTMGLRPWVEEAGIASIVLVGKSGHGDSPAVTAATEAMRKWDGWSSGSKDIWFVNVGAPRQHDDTSQGEWFICSVPCDYKAQERLTLQP